MGEAGVAIAGPGAKTAFRDAERVAAEHGGQSSEWAKMTSSSYAAADGTRMAVIPNRDLAFAVVRQNDMEPVSVH